MGADLQKNEGLPDWVRFGCRCGRVAVLLRQDEAVQVGAVQTEAVQFRAVQCGSPTCQMFSLFFLPTISLFFSWGLLVELCASSLFEESGGDSGGGSAEGRFKGQSGGRAVDVGNSGEVATDAWLPQQFADLGRSQWFRGLWDPLVECCIFQIPEFQIFVTPEGAQHMLAFWTQQEPEGADTDTERSRPQAKQKNGERHRGGNGSLYSSNRESSCSSGPKRCSARTSGQDDDGGNGPKGLMNRVWRVMETQEQVW